MNSNMEKPYVVGIDIGGTNTVFGIVDARGTIIASSSIKTAGYPTAAEYADEVCKNLLPLIIANGGVDKIRGIGVGAPNGNYYTGTIEFAPILPWKGILPLAAMFEERLGIPTALTNDANAAAIGEMTYGTAPVLSRCKPQKAKCTRSGISRPAGTKGVGTPHAK